MSPDSWQISLLEVPFSEHSSYSELKRFLKFLRIKDVSQVNPYRRFSLGGWGVETFHRTKLVEDRKISVNLPVSRWCQQ